MRKAKWDPDSPRFRQACLNLRIDKSEVELKTRRQFEQTEARLQERQSGTSPLSKELAAIKYGYHLQNVKDFLNDIIHERKRIIVRSKIAEIDNRSSTELKTAGRSVRTFKTVTNVTNFEGSEIALTDVDMRQITMMRARNQAFAKKLLLERDRKLNVEQRLHDSESKAKQKLKNLTILRS